MKTVQLRKLVKRIGMGMALMLTVGTIPFRAFASESPKATVTFEVASQITGDETQKEDTFTFLLAAQDEETPMPESDIVTIRGTGRAAFGEITYTSVGTYEYTISQKNSDLDGYTLDSSVYYVSVTVAQQEDGSLLPVVTVRKNRERDKSGDIVFYNLYTEPETTLSTETETETEIETQSETEPDKPVPPSTPDKPRTGNTPKTGDSMHISLWLTLLLVSGLLAGGLWKHKKN